MRFWIGMRGSAWSLALIGLAAAAVGPVGTFAQGQPRVELPRDPDQVVVYLHERPGEVAGDDHPWMRIYADGRIERHLPAYMKRAGNYSIQIDRQRLEGLVAALAWNGLLEFDPKAVRERMNQREKGAGTHFYSSDPSRIEIRVALASYQRPGSLETERDAQRQVVWSGLRADARRHKEDLAIQGLNSVFLQLNELAGRVVERGVRMDEEGSR